MKRTLSSLAVYGLLLFAALLAVFPLLWMVSVSFMQTGAASTFPPPLWPSDPTLAHYRQLLAQGGIGRAFANSLSLAVAATLISTTFNTLAGYALPSCISRGASASLRCSSARS